jgi:hypothetical protein
MTLTVTASSTAAGGLVQVAPGSTVVLTAPGGSALIKASDDDGVSWVELWMGKVESCDGSINHFDFARAKRVEGDVSATEAPTSLTAGVDINLLRLRSGCTYTFEVGGRSANAATTPVESRYAPFARLRYTPP